MMGRHHARLLQALERVQFVGAVDPGGDRFRAVRDPALVFASTAELLDATPVDFAVVAVPTELHFEAVSELAHAGVSVLVEKPLAATADEARELIALCAAQGVLGAVGHVERFNPALLELRRRVQLGQLGDVFHIATERVGPFPDRVRDVGVVKDLATHDIDLVQWLGGAPVEVLAAQTQNRSGRIHEDLVLIQGALGTGVSFNSVVDWLTPMKSRRTRILGERGMLLADTLAGDLFFYENGHVAVEWTTASQFRGVSEGDMTRYALSRREPLLAELEAFLDVLEGAGADAVVTLDQGLQTVRIAEAVLESARTAESVRLVA